MSLIRKHGAVLQAWACLDLVVISSAFHQKWNPLEPIDWSMDYYSFYHYRFYFYHQNIAIFVWTL